MSTEEDDFSHDNPCASVSQHENGEASGISFIFYMTILNIYEIMFHKTCLIVQEYGVVWLLKNKFQKLVTQFQDINKLGIKDKLLR